MALSYPVVLTYTCIWHLYSTCGVQHTDFDASWVALCVELTPAVIMTSCDDRGCFYKGGVCPPSRPLARSGMLMC